MRSVLACLAIRSLSLALLSSPFLAQNGTVAEEFVLDPSLTLASGNGSGSAVAGLGDLDGDGRPEVAIGAAADFPSGGGAVRIFERRDDGSLVLLQKVSRSELPGSGVASRLGSALALLGDLDGDGTSDLAVGAPSEDSDRGAVWFFFLRADGTVRENARIGTGSLPLMPSDFFGGSLAPAGDRNGDGVPDLFVGARGDDSHSASAGAAWLLFLAPDGTLVGSQRITEGQGGFAGVLDVGDSFGSAVSALGDLDGNGTADLAVGASGDDDGGSDQGAVWILFLGPGGQVQGQAKISETQGGFGGRLDPFDFFGSALVGLDDLDGDGVADLAVGATGDTDQGDAGTVWVVFLRTDGSVREHAKLGRTSGGISSPIPIGAAFGSALGTLAGSGGPVLLVGGIAAAQSRGTTWFLELAPDGTVVVDSTWSPPAPPDRFYGRAFASLGDLGRDGTLDLVVAQDGLPWLLGVNRQGGIVSARRLPVDLPPVLFPDAQRYSLTALGDVDGNGTPDLALGIPGRTTFSGSVHVALLDPSGVLLAERSSPGDSRDFGFAVAGIGDLDGDGVPDLVTGEPGNDDGGTNKGAVWVLFLNADGSTRARQKISALAGGFAGTLHPGDRFGAALAALGDLDGDGTIELAVGAPNGGDDLFFDDRGEVWILSLEATGSVVSQRRIASGVNGFSVGLSSGDRFGQSLACVGDLDLDGVPELAVGRPGLDGPSGTNVGGLHVLFLNPNKTVRSQQAISLGVGGFQGTGTGGFPLGAGFSVGLACVGDWNQDGVPDLVVGASLRGNRVWLLALDGLARLDFEHESDGVTPLANGQALATPAEFSGLIALSSSGANLGPAVFDSTLGGPNDPSQDRDLLVGKQNLLILQNSLVPTQTVPGTFDRPNDDQDGGLVRFAFDARVRVLSLDLVDIDGSESASTLVTLTDDFGGARTYTVPPGWTEDLLTDGAPAWRSLDLTTLAPQAGFQAVATAVESAGFSPAAVRALEVQLAGSGALDELVYDPHP